MGESGGDGAVPV